MNVHSWTGMYDSSAPALEYSTGFRPFCALTISPFTFRRKNREPPGYAMSYILLILNLRERDKSMIFDRRRKRKKQGYTQLPKAQITYKSCRLYQNTFDIYVYLQISCLVGTSFRPPLLFPPLPFTHVRSLVQYRLQADPTGTSEGALVLLVLVICQLTVEITSKEVSIYFVNYDTLTPLRY